MKIFTEEPLLNLLRERVCEIRAFTLCETFKVNEVYLLKCVIIGDVAGGGEGGSPYRFILTLEQETQLRFSDHF